MTSTRYLLNHLQPPHHYLINHLSSLHQRSLHHLIQLGTNLWSVLCLVLLSSRVSIDVGFQPSCPRNSFPKYLPKHVNAYTGYLASYLGSPILLDGESLVLQLRQTCFVYATDAAVVHLICLACAMVLQAMSKSAPLMLLAFT